MKPVFIISQLARSAPDPVLQTLTCVLGPAHLVPIDRFPEALQAAGRLVVYLHQDADCYRMLDLLQNQVDRLLDIPLGWVLPSGLGLTPEMIKKQLGALDMSCMTVPDHRDITPIIDFSLELRQRPADREGLMPPADLKPYIEAFLSGHNTCTLSTCYLGQVSSRPIEYRYANAKLYMVSEGGEKFAGLLTNHQAAVTVNEPYQGFNKLAGLQLKGQGSLQLPGSELYQSAISAFNLNPGRIEALPTSLNIIVVHLEEAEYLWSGFKNLGLDVRQTYHF